MSEVASVSPPPTEATPQRERFSDGQMAELVSAVGHEAKAILLVQMEPDTAYTAGDLDQLMTEGQGQDPGWRMARSGPSLYCQRSFKDSHLVREVKVSIRDNLQTRDNLQATAYVKTSPYGEEDGTILAALLANYSKDHPDVSLYQLFASRKSRYISKDSQYMQRASITRMKIFWELTTASLPLRQQDMIDAVKESDSVVEEHLEQLNRMGVIERKTFRKGEPITRIKLAPNHPVGPPMRYKDRSRLTKFVYQALLDNPDKEWTLEELTKGYLQQETEAGQQERAERSLKKDIVKICSRFVKNGYIQKGEFTSAKQATINLSPEQRQNLVDLVTLLDAFQRRDAKTWENGRAAVQYFKDHPEEVSALMKKARENSPNANQRLRENTAGLIDSVLSQHPGLTRIEIQKVLENLPEPIFLSIDTISAILLKFEFPRIKKKGVKHFYSHSKPSGQDLISEQEDVAA